MELDEKVKQQIDNAYLRSKSEEDRNAVFKENLLQYLKNKELNEQGDIILNEYEELKQSDNKDFLDEAIK